MRPEEKIQKRFKAECAKFGIRSETLKRPGKKGWPDESVFLPLAQIVIIQFKRPGGTTDHHQDECHKELRELGFRVLVCDNWENPLQVVKQYLGRNKYE